MTEQHASRASSPRMARRRAQTRERILDAAADVFDVSGLRNGRVEDIAEAADVSVGAIYTHFDDKQDIVLGLAERSIQKLGETLEGALANPATSPMERFMSLADLYAKFFLEHRSSFHFLVASGPDSIGTSGAGVESVLTAERRLLDRFQDAIQTAIDAGQIDAAYDARIAARFLWGAWNGVITLGLRGDGLALSEAEVIAALDLGRRLVNEGLTAPSYRDETGRSRVKPR